jgi:hypothetical protein
MARFPLVYGSKKFRVFVLPIFQRCYGNVKKISDFVVNSTEQGIIFCQFAKRLFVFRWSPTGLLFFLSAGAIY